MEICRPGANANPRSYEAYEAQTRRSTPVPLFVVPCFVLTAGILPCACNNRKTTYVHYAVMSCAVLRKLMPGTINQIPKNQYKKFHFGFFQNFLMSLKNRQRKL